MVWKVSFWTVPTGGFIRVKFRVEDYKCGGSPGLYIRKSSIFIIHKWYCNWYQSEIRLFADDTSLYVTVDTPQNAADIINRDLEKIHQWSVNWLVKFYPKKTETMVISRKLIKPLHPPLEMNSQILQQGTNYKHLGLFFWVVARSHRLHC